MQKREGHQEISKVHKSIEGASQGQKKAQSRDIEAFSCSEIVP
jgi:hypothetical protein